MLIQIKHPTEGAPSLFFDPFRVDFIEEWLEYNDGNKTPVIHWTIVCGHSHRQVDEATVRKIVAARGGIYEDDPK